MKPIKLSKVIGIGALAICAALMPHSVYAQRTNQTPTNLPVAQTTSKKTLTEPGNSSRVIPFSNAEDYMKSIFSLQEDDRLNLIKAKSDQLGFTHYKYQQVYKGLPVVGRTVTLHVREGNIQGSTHNYVKVRQLDNVPKISANQGLQMALDRVGPKTYAWDSDKKISEPKGELVVLNHPVTHINYLAYKYDVFAYDPIFRADIFVDAATGEIVFEHERIHVANVPASGNSLYNGLVNFTADQVGPTSFRLRADTTGVGVSFETYTMNNTFDYGLATDITSTSANSWTDSAGVQAHWGAFETFDYFKTEHNRNSYDDAGSPIYSFVHAGVGYVNAFWNGFAMTYGDGNGINYGPLVALDICGHEIAHGVTQFSAGLFYQLESGALNESFSDIFGEMVEKHGAGSNDWQLGTDIGIGGSGAIRSMDNPNLFYQPDTYLGLYWQDNANCNPTPYNDYCGVHGNSGVQNKWFYILVEGESGTNDHGYSYNVPSIGSTQAAAIAYRNLTVYLTSTSTHEDARVGSIQAAMDLYGAATANIVDSAWKAVGVYPGVTPTPLPPGPPPANDLCINAIPYSCGSTMIGTTIDAGIDSSFACDPINNPITAPGVWYSFVASDAFTAVYTCAYETNLSYDTRLTVFSDTCGALTCIGDNDDACGFFGTLSGINVPTVPGETYYVLVHGWGNSVGVFGLTVSCTPQPNVLSLVSDGSWNLSTTVTTATSNMYPWPGVPSVPHDSTFTLPAIVGQPYPWHHVYEVAGSDAIKAESGVTYYRKTFNLANHLGLSARLRMFVDDNMEIFVNGIPIAIEVNTNKGNYRTANHDILYTDNGQINNGFNGGDWFDAYNVTPMDNILVTGTNEVVLAIRNRTSKPDKGGFSFRMDLGQAGPVPPFTKSGVVNSTPLVSSEIDVRIYPNPTDGIVSISLTGKSFTESTEVMVLDLAGGIVYRGKLSSESNEYQMDFSEYPSGMYLVKIIDGGSTYTKSLIKQ